MNQDIFLLLGTNKGDKKKNLLDALSAIEAVAGHILVGSAVYQTAAWGKMDQDMFYNQAIRVESALTPQSLLRELLAIETKLGRTRIEKWGARLIDIDILLFGSRIIDEPDLTVPHPRMQDRKFALIPLAEIASTFVHPQYGVTIETLLHRCIDPLTVEKVSD